MLETTNEQTVENNIQTVKKERDKSLDFLKGIAIFLMIWGHCIQWNGHIFIVIVKKIFQG